MKTGFGRWEKSASKIKTLTTLAGFLALVWLIEAGIIFGVGIAYAFYKSASRVFCERCQKWMQHQPAVVTRSNDDVENLRETLLAGNPMPTVKCQSAGITRILFFSEIDLFNCPTCDEYHYLTLNTVTLSVDKRTCKVNRKETPLINKLRVADEIVKVLQAAPTYFPPTPDESPAESPDAAPKEADLK